MYMNREAESYAIKAQKYLEEAKDYKNSSDITYQEQRKQTLILGSIAASLIALAKK